MSKELMEGRVTSKGQLVVPVQLRRKYGIRTGTRVRFVERPDGIVLRPVTAAYIRSVCGMLHAEGSVTDELLAERRRERARDEGRVEKPRPR